MNKNENLYLPQLKVHFPVSKNFRRSELRDFFRKQEAELTDTAFRRKVYALEKMKIIRKADRGRYCLDVVKLEDAQTIPLIRKKYIPTLTPEIRVLSSLLEKSFPFTTCLVWDTRILHEFMLHQPGQSQIILEVEKEATESVFNFLANHYPGKVFLEPTQPIFERYVISSPDNIIVSHLISRSPMQIINGIHCPKIEKILVDIFADEDKFLALHGQELVNIYENTFQSYLVSERTLFSYAERRRVHVKIRNFIIQNTNIQLKPQ